MIKSPVHLNSNLWCVVDVETTGPTVGEHDIWQLCVLPLDINLKPAKGIIPFCLKLKPHNKESMSKYISRENMADAILTGVDPYVAADMLLEWFDKKLALKQGKKICVITHDWPYVGSFLKYWMGPSQFEILFHEWYRDLIPVSLYLNDSADLNIEQIPHPKSDLSFLCARLQVTNERRNDALSDCVAIAECYRRILKRLF